MSEAPKTARPHTLQELSAVQSFCKRKEGKRISLNLSCGRNELQGCPNPTLVVEKIQHSKTSYRFSKKKYEKTARGNAEHWRITAHSNLVIELDAGEICKFKISNFITLSQHHGMC